MKRILCVFAFVAILATGTAFADHPDGWGVGIVGNLSIHHDRDGHGVHAGLGGIGLSLKIPAVPIYWGFFLRGLGEKHSGGGVTGDYYFIDDHIDGPWHWYFGLGGFFNLDVHKHTYANKDYTYNWMNFGLRIPIGVSVQPMDWFELFIQAVPSVGLAAWGDGTYKDESGKKLGREPESYFFWGVPIEFGIRFWF
ncbi:MAG: DUF3996 domain-containing protein [Treponema sp.]|nr:DUF3996 domain-containing protein [Treponema sp.]